MKLFIFVNAAIPSPKHMQTASGNFPVKGILQAMSLTLPHVFVIQSELCWLNNKTFILKIVFNPDATMYNPASVYF